MRLFVLAAAMAIAAPAFAQTRVVGAPAGSGLYPAIAEGRADAPGYTIYRPARMPRQPLPLVLWGNGACRDNGLSASHFLREIASNGYVVIANGAPRQERPVVDRLPAATAPPAAPPPTARTRDETSLAQLLGGIDWATRATASPRDPLYRRVDTSKVAVLGHSCGGLQAIAAGADPRIATVMALASGVYQRPNGGRSGIAVTKDDLRKLHTPIAYILGGPDDIAFPNGSDDVARIGHVPVFLGSLPVGHGGTFDLANGGDWARVATDWLDWQLKGDRQAAKTFVGTACRLCTTFGWTVQRKQFPEKP